MCQARWLGRVGRKCSAASRVSVASNGHARIIHLWLLRLAWRLSKMPRVARGREIAGGTAHFCGGATEGRRELVRAAISQGAGACEGGAAAGWERRVIAPCGTK